MTQNGINSVNSILTSAIEEGVIHLSATNEKIADNIIEINGIDLVNFGSCSYLGLELHEKMKSAAVQAIQNFGTQFSSSRAYVSLSLYDEFESKLEKIFEAPVIVAPSTTLAHIAAIPVVVEDGDAIILDHQVHNTVQTAVQLLKGRRIHVEMIRHNRMDLLEQKIIDLKGQHNKIWYMADGIYSMYGDFSPVDEVLNLMDKYDQLHYYVDDAHGMSCYGDRGEGSVLSGRSIHPKMIVATSFAKAFATGGGVLIFPNREIAQKVRNCGAPFNSSGPMQPASLGAAIAAADMHLSGEIKSYQKKLHDNMTYTKQLLTDHGLPDVSEKNSPIFFVGVGLPKVAYNLLNRMMTSGHYLNLGIFPTVPIKNTGIRFTVTSLHSFEQIREMISDMAFHYPLAMKDENFTIEQVYKAFKIKAKTKNQDLSVVKNSSIGLIVNRFKSVIDIKKNEWNSILGERGAFDWNALNVLENSFTGNDLPEENWDFNYIIIRDAADKIVLATFTTSGIVKDDMLAEKEISVDIEKCREDDPYFYTSNFLSTGCLITEGDHLYIDRDHPAWKEGAKLLFQELEKLQQNNKASTLMIRDICSGDKELEHIMIQNGYIKMEMPEKFKLDITSWANPNEFYENLSKRSKRHFRENVKRHQDEFEIRFLQNVDDSTIQDFYNLYMNVYSKSFEINTHALPYKFFEKVAQNHKWEMMELSLKETHEIVGVVFAYRGTNSYIGNLVGLDYSHNEKHNVYRQAIYQLLLRAKELELKEVQFGFSAGVEKKKFGAKAEHTASYIQLKDNFVMESLIPDSFSKNIHNKVLSIKA